MVTVKEKKKICNDLLSKQRGILMGISILLIMLYHFTEDCHNSGVHFNGWVQFYYKYIHSSSVDTFLFLSGLGLYYSMKKNPDIMAFYRRRLTKILIPYVVIAFPAWIWKDLIFKKSGIYNFVKDFTFLSFKNGVKWYWYIFLILICYLIFPYIFRIVEHAKDSLEGELHLLTLVGVYTVMLMGLKLYGGDTYGNFEIALTRIPIFLAGCFYGRSSYEQRESYWKWGVIFIGCLAALYLFPADMPILNRYINGLLNVSICAGLAVFFTKVNTGVVEKFLKWCGLHSLELYLSHVTVRRIMISYGFHTSHYRYEGIMIGISFVLAFLLAVVSRGLQKLIHIKRREDKGEK